MVCDSMPSCSVIRFTPWIFQWEISMIDDPPGLCALLAEGGRWMGDNGYSFEIQSDYFERVGCEDCPAGKASGAVSAASLQSCADCPLGTFSEAGSAACKHCPAGTYILSPAGQGRQACRPCVAGKYSAEAGATSSLTCKQCSPGNLTPKPYTLYPEPKLLTPNP